jgi:hypothetical protein
VDSNDITALVSGEQKHCFHEWGRKKSRVTKATSGLSPHSNTTLLNDKQTGILSIYWLMFVSLDMLVWAAETFLCT